MAEHFREDERNGDARVARELHYADQGPVIQGPWSEAEATEELRRGLLQGLSTPIGSDFLVKTPDQQRAFTKDLFRHAFRDPGLTLDDLVTQRTCVMWRILRAWAVLFDLCGPDLLLGELLRRQDPFEPLQVPSIGEGELRVASPRRRRVLRELQETPISLLLPANTPADDPRRALYCDLLVETAQGLGIPGGAPESPRLGRYGLRFLAEPAFVVEALPTPHHLVAWEDLILDQTMTQIAERGAYEAAKRLTAQFGIGQREARVLIAAGRARAQHITEAPEEQNRAIAQMRLEAIFSRAREVDPRVALQSVKQMALIQGLTKAAPDTDEFREEVEAMGEVIEEQEGSRQLGYEDAP